ncbi:hypothetical protein ABC502_07995 [Alkalimonas sp. NCh-2]|uniref:hypothetical protein n=1 Tax=Alkalimonas sp. NCh-2 TaxID=3144846 RepID=UPI0031F6734D
MKTITASTPVAERRFHDLDAFYLRGRNISARPGSGECRIKVSHDDGATYDAVNVISGQPEAGTIRTYDLKIEFECTADAVLVVGN